MADAQENHQITLAEAAQLTANYRGLPAVSLLAALEGMKAQSLPVSAVQAVLSQPGADSLRIYFGADLVPPSFKLILVAVDADGNDMTAGFIADRAKPCPPKCSKPNILNSDIS